MSEAQSLFSTSHATSLEQKVGRLILARIPSYTLEEPHAGALAAGTIGGAVLFKENASSLEQLASLCAQIVETSLHPPVLTVDQEGGAVQRFDQILTPLPSAMSLGVRGDMDLVKKAASINASQLALMGFNCLLSPVLDVASNPKNPIIGSRAFGTTADQVIKCGIETAKAILAEGLIPVGKHFPGHGSTKEDSHAELAVYEGTIEDLENIELRPFKECMHVLPAILTAHIWVKALDGEWRPASLSPKIIGELLRKRLRFDKLIMTDDMLMKAITARYGIGEAAVLAVEAGNDLLLVCGTFEDSMEAHRHLVEAVRTGRVSSERLEESVSRINRLFGERKEHADPQRSPERFNRLMASIDENRKCALSLAGITNLRGDVRLTPGRWQLFVPKHSRYSMRLKEELDELKKNRKNSDDLEIEEIRYTPDLKSDEIEQLIERYSGGNCLLVTFRAAIMTGQLELAVRLETRMQSLKRIALRDGVPRDRASRIILVAGDTPYELDLLPLWENAASTLDPSDLAFKNLAKEIYC